MNNFGGRAAGRTHQMVEETAQAARLHLEKTGDSYSILAHVGSVWFAEELRKVLPEPTYVVWLEGEVVKVAKGA